MNSSRLLENFPLVRTRKAEEMEKALAQVYARPTLRLVQPGRTLNAWINECRLQNVSLACGTYGAAVQVEFPAVDYFLQLSPVRGKGKIINGRQPVALGVGSGAVISPDQGYRARYDGSYACLILKIRGKALTSKLAAMTGCALGAPLRMHPQTDFAQPAARMLYDYLPLLAQTLSTASPPLPVWWISQTEEFLMTMFLCGNRHNYSHLLEQDVKDAAPHEVRRAEEYIRANWQNAITIEDLARVAGVSVFSLYRSFRKARGYSPQQLLARLRATQGKEP